MEIGPIGLVAGLLFNNVILITAYYKLKIQNNKLRKHVESLKEKALIERLPVVEKYYKMGQFKEGEKVHHVTVTGKILNGEIISINEYVFTEVIFVIPVGESYPQAFNPHQLEKGWK